MYLGYLLAIPATITCVDPFFTQALVLTLKVKQKYYHYQSPAPISPTISNSIPVWCSLTAATLFGSGDMNRLRAVIRYTAKSMFSGARPEAGAGGTE